MMPRFETTDKIALLIAALLMAGGFFALLVPQDFAFGRATNFLRLRPQTIAEHVSTRQSRFYGLGAIIAGGALSTYILWASRAR